MTATRRPPEPAGPTGAGRCTAGSCPPPTPRSWARSAGCGCVYKPVAGERPLWDFPDGTLAGREVAAYVVSRGLGLGRGAADLVLRDGPHGPGMVQRWQEPDADQEPVDLVPERRGARPAGDTSSTGSTSSDRAGLAGPRGLRRRCAGWPSSTWSSTTPTARAGTSWRWPTATATAWTTACTFHEERKLRTVLWGWLGEPLDDEELAARVRVSRRASTAGSERPGRPRSPSPQTAPRWTSAALHRRRRTLLAPAPDARAPRRLAGPIPWPPFWTRLD